MTPGEPPPGWQVVHWHPEAPPKPPEGAPCNGCGLCCLAEPCPLGMLVSRRRTGACVALRWSAADGRQSPFLLQIPLVTPPLAGACAEQKNIHP